MSGCWQSVMGPWCKATSLIVSVVLVVVGGIGLVGKLRESSSEAIFLVVYPSIGFAGVGWRLR